MGDGSASPDLHESAWAKATADTRAAWLSWEFLIGSAVIGILGAGAGVLLSSGSASSTDQAAVVVVVPLGVLVGLLLAVFGFQLLAAPVRQRDALRRAWPLRGNPSSAETEARLSSLSRRGHDLARKVEREGSHSPGDVAALEKWTGAVEKVLIEAGEPSLSMRYSLSSRGDKQFLQILRKRLAALDELTCD